MRLLYANKRNAIYDITNKFHSSTNRLFLWSYLPFVLGVCFSMTLISGIPLYFHFVHTVFPRISPPPPLNELPKMETSFKYTHTHTQEQQRNLFSREHTLATVSFLSCVLMSCSILYNEAKWCFPSAIKTVSNLFE